MTSYLGFSTKKLEDNGYNGVFRWGWLVDFLLKDMKKMHHGHDIYSGLRIEKEYDEMTDSIRR